MKTQTHMSDGDVFVCLFVFAVGGLTCCTTTAFQGPLEFLLGVIFCMAIGAATMALFAGMFLFSSVLTQNTLAAWRARRAEAKLLKRQREDEVVLLRDRCASLAAKVDLLEAQVRGDSPHRPKV